MFGMATFKIADFKTNVVGVCLEIIAENHKQSQWNAARVWGKLSNFLCTIKVILRQP